MKAQKLPSGAFRIDLQPGEISALQFVLGVMDCIYAREVFAGRLMRRVRRLHKALREVM